MGTSLSMTQGGYRILDVRSAVEFVDASVPQSVNVPIINAVRKFDAELKKKACGPRFDRQRLQLVPHLSLG